MVGDFIYTNANGVEKGVLQGFELDMAWGYDENDFELKVGTSPALECGSLIYVNGTEWGGIVDKRDVDETGDAIEVTYSGRTWHGILNGHILCPESGQAYLGYDHDPNDLIRIIIANASLDDVFEAPDAVGETISGRFYRYCTAYDGLKMELWRHGYRLDFCKQPGGKVLVQAVKASDFSGDYWSDRFAFKVEQEMQHVNHLVALGNGELGSREVVHVYADADGNVSTTQSLFGLSERTEVYTCSATDTKDDSSDSDTKTLTEEAIEKLQEYQEEGSNIDIQVDDSLGAHVGDTIGAHSVNTPASVTGTVNKIVLNIDEKGQETISYEVGTLVEDTEEIE